MSSVLGIDTAIGWAHWRLRGGWKNILTTTAVYSLMLGGLIMFTLRLNPGFSSRVLAGWSTGLIWIQAGILVLFAGSRVSGAIVSDVSTRMIESHRLMPVSPATAISGYLWGPTSQATILALATFLIGCLVTLAGGVSLSVWIGPNVILASFAVFCWTVYAFAGSVAKGASGLVFMLFMGLGTSAGNGAVLAPGLAVLASPLIGKTIFTESVSNTELSWPLMVSLLAQIYIGSIFYIGAARKYRKSEDTALAVLPAMMLLIGWVAVCAIAMKWWREFAPVMFPRRMGDIPNLFPSSIFTSMFLALVPVANSARDRRLAKFSPLIAVVCGPIISALALPLPGDDRGRPMMLTVLTTVACLLGVCFLLRIVYRRTARGWLFGFVWMAVTWLGPVLIDYGRWQLGPALNDFEPSIISACSPAASLIMIWGDTSVPAGLLERGIIAQWMLSAAMALLFYATSRKKRVIHA